MKKELISLICAVCVFLGASCTNTGSVESPGRQLENMTSSVSPEKTEETEGLQVDTLKDSTSGATLSERTQAWWKPGMEIPVIERREWVEPANVLPPPKYVLPKEKPVSRWIDEKNRKPMTYKKYKEFHPVLKPLEARPVLPKQGSKSRRRSQHSVTMRVILPRVLVAVNERILGDVRGSVERYMDDLRSEGYAVELYTVEGGTPEEFRGVLRQKYLNVNLVGCVIVGDVPVAWFESDNRDYPQFPSDYYYMDLDGNWRDGDRDGILDTHEDGDGDRYPEIWVGRLTASTLHKEGRSEADLYNEYFARNHAWRTGEEIPGAEGPDEPVVVPVDVSPLGDDSPVREQPPVREAVHEGRALAYVDEDFQFLRYAGLDLLYPQDRIDLVRDANTTTADDYLWRLGQPYEFIHVNAHGTAFGQTFMENFQFQDDEYVTNADLRERDMPRARFFNIVSCGTVRYVEEDYLGGWYIFGDSGGLAALGCTHSFIAPEFDHFYRALGHGASMGAALTSWVRTFHSWFDLFTSYFHGMSLLGDPTLVVRPGNADWDGRGVPKMAPLPDLKVKNIYFTQGWDRRTGEFTDDRWVVASIKNEGEAPVPAGAWWGSELWIDGVMVWARGAPWRFDWDPGVSSGIQFPVRAPEGIEEHEYSVVLDRNNLLLEIDDSVDDNSLTVRIGDYIDLEALSVEADHEEGELRFEFRNRGGRHSTGFRVSCVLIDNRVEEESGFWWGTLDDPGPGSSVGANSHQAITWPLSWLYDIIRCPSLPEELRMSLTPGSEHSLDGFVDYYREVEDDINFENNNTSGSFIVPDP